MSENMAWLAGVLESEGSIRINTPTKRNWGALLVDMVNTDLELVAPFQEHWPGYLREVPANGNRRAYWRYRCAATVAARLLTDLMPYFRSERMRERALLALRFQAQKRAGVRTDDYREQQQAFYEQMKALNVRGPHAGVWRNRTKGD